MAIALKTITVTDADGLILVDRRPLCSPHAAGYKQNASPSWRVEFAPVGFVTECPRCIYENA